MNWQEWTIRPRAANKFSSNVHALGDFSMNIDTKMPSVRKRSKKKSANKKKMNKNTAMYLDEDDNMCASSNN